MSYNEFVEGDRVELVRASSKYKRIPVGVTGTVRNVYNPSSIRVHLDDYTNITSKYGDYYFDAKHLKYINYESNNEGSIIIMTGNYRVAEVQFIDGTNTDKTYFYACYDPSITDGDICVVKTAHHGFGIAKVREFTTTTEELTREIVCKCDFSEYNKRVENRKRMIELKDLMTARAKKLQDIALFQMLAKDDFEMAALLNEFNILMGGETDGR